MSGAGYPMSAKPNTGWPFYADPVKHNALIVGRSGSSKSSFLPKLISELSAALERQADTVTVPTDESHGDPGKERRGHRKWK